MSSQGVIEAFQRIQRGPRGISGCIRAFQGGLRSVSEANSHGLSYMLSLHTTSMLHSIYECYLP